MAGAFHGKRFTVRDRMCNVSLSTECPKQAHEHAMVLAKAEHGVSVTDEYSGARYFRYQFSGNVLGFDALLKL